MAQVLLCDSSGSITGQMEKVQAHQCPGHLHRAFSVFVFRNSGTELLIQKRHPSKLFGGLWANSCCSHPSDESVPVINAAERRLQEELGFTCPITEVGSFVYRAEDPNGKGVEHEYDTVLVGHVSGDVTITPNPDEVIEWQWVKVDAIPEDGAPWFPLGLAVALA